MPRLFVLVAMRHAGDGVTEGVSVCQLFEFEEQFLELLGGEPAVQGAAMRYSDGPGLF